jgi:hypothetical protein
MNRDRVLPLLFVALAVAGAAWLLAREDESPVLRRPEPVAAAPEGTVALAAAPDRETPPTEERAPLDVGALLRAIQGDDPKARAEALGIVRRGVPFDRALALALIAIEESGTREERAHAQQGLCAMGPDVVPLLGPLLGSDSEVTRFWAVGILCWPAATPGAERASPYLAAALADEMGRVRLTALRACGFGVVAAPEVVRALQSLLDSEYGDERRLAAEALGAMGPASLEAVWPLLASSDETRWVLAERALFRIRPADVRAVRHHLRDALLHPDAAVVLRAGAALRAVVEDEEVLGWLRAALGGSEATRQGALLALAARSRIPSDLLAEIVAALRSENTTTRSYAAHALGRVRDRETDARAVEALTAVALESHDPPALHALGALGGPGTIGLLEVLDRSADPLTRRGALDLLLEQRPRAPGLDRRLAEIAGDAKDALMRQAFYSLADGEGSRADLLPIARRLLVEPDRDGEWIWLEPIASVFAAAKADLSPEISRLLASDDGSLRRRGLDVLVQVEQPDLLPFAEALSALVTDEDATVRRYLVLLFARLGGQGGAGIGTARTQLRVLADDDDNWVRGQARQALERLGG